MFITSPGVRVPRGLRNVSVRNPVRGSTEEATSVAGAGALRGSSTEEGAQSKSAYSNSEVPEQRRTPGGATESSRSIRNAAAVGVARKSTRCASP